MLTGIVRTVAPTTYPVSLADVKSHLAITGTQDDARLQSYIAAATNQIEAKTGRGFMAQTWVEYHDCFPRERYMQAFETVRSPVSSVSSLTYYDDSNTLQSLTQGTSYYAVLPTDSAAILSPVRSLSGVLDPWWPSEYRWRPDCIALTYVCAWSPLPDMLVHAVKLLVAYWNDGNRGSNDLEIPTALEDVIAHLRYGWYS